MEKFVSFTHLTFVIFHRIISLICMDRRTVITRYVAKVASIDINQAAASTVICKHMYAAA